MDASQKMRSTRSRSADKLIPNQHSRNTEDLKKFGQIHRATPFLRACGCAHRFSPTTNESTKSLSGFKRRSKSCTPVRTHLRIESDGTESKTAKTDDSLTRHTSEDNLQFKQVMEIREKLELIPLAGENYRWSPERKMAPQRYKTTISIDLNTSERKYMEEISFEVYPTENRKERFPAYTTTIEAIIEHTVSTSRLT